MTAREAAEILKGSFSEFNKDKAMRLGAALAYYSVFSLAPLLVIAIGVAGLFFGEPTVHKRVSEQISGLVGQGGAQTLESMMAARNKNSSIWATIIGLLVLLLGASGVFGQLQDALNTIWEVKPKPGGGIWGFIRNRFLSMTMVLGTGFLLLVSLLLTTAVSAAAGYIQNVIPVPEAALHAVNFILSFAVVSLLFAMIFKVLPDVKVKWRDVWVGAIGTALLFTVGKYVLGLYLGRKGFASSYGAAGSFVVILLWVYYSSLILLFGAEFTQVFAHKTGSSIAPTENAVAVTREQREEEGLAPAVAAAAPSYARAKQEEPRPVPVSGRHAVRGLRPQIPPVQLAALISAAFLLPILLRKQAVKLGKQLVETVTHQRKARNRAASPRG